MESCFDGIAREDILGLPVYSPGLDIDDVKSRYGVDRVIKLASNENPLGPSPSVIEAVRNAAADIHLYPDGNCTDLRRRLAEELAVEPGNLVFGNGTDEVIDFIFYAFFNRCDRAVMGEPTFSSYFLSGMMMGAEIVYSPLCDYRHHAADLLSLVDDRTKAVFIGTPHNPTGTICLAEELEEILGALPENVLLLWDEAYREYVEDPRYPDSIPFLRKYRNLVILRTFSKIYGLAGLRIGYAIAHPEIVGMLERVRPPFNVNRLAQVAAVAALDDPGHVEKSRRLNSEGKRYLAGELARLGLKAVPTEANFILFQFDNVTHDLTARLIEKGIIVRDGEALGYPGHIRLTIGTPEENREVIQAIELLINAD